MDRLKRLRKALFVDGGLFFSVVLLLLATFSVSQFVDWSTPVDDLDAQERARIEDCVMAGRALGDDLYKERPDCRGYLEPRPPATAGPTP